MQECLDLRGETRLFRTLLRLLCLFRPFLSATRSPGQVEREKERGKEREREKSERESGKAGGKERGGRGGREREIERDRESRGERKREREKQGDTSCCLEGCGPRLQGLEVRVSNVGFGVGDWVIWV